MATFFQKAGEQVKKKAEEEKKKQESTEQVIKNYAANVLKNTKTSIQNYGKNASSTKSSSSTTSKTGNNSSSKTTTSSTNKKTSNTGSNKKQTVADTILLTNNDAKNKKTNSILAGIKSGTQAATKAAKDEKTTAKAETDTKKKSIDYLLNGLGKGTNTVKNATKEVQSNLYAINTIANVTGKEPDDETIKKLRSEQKGFSSYAAKEGEVPNPSELYSMLPDETKNSWLKPGTSNAMKNLLSVDYAKKYVNANWNKDWANLAAERAEAEQNKENADRFMKVKDLIQNQAWNNITSDTIQQNRTVYGGLLERPEDYNDRPDEYDRELYDAYHGTGQYDNIVRSGNRQQWLDMTEEIRNLWRDVDSGAVKDVYETEQGIHMASPDDYIAQTQSEHWSDQLKNIESREKRKEEYNALIDQYGYEQATPAQNVPVENSNRGIQSNTILNQGTVYSGLLERPEDYNDHPEEYDRELYDAYHGEGQYDTIAGSNNRQAKLDMWEEIRNLWNDIDNGAVRNIYENGWGTNNTQQNVGNVPEEYNRTPVRGDYNPEYDKGGFGYTSMADIERGVQTNDVHRIYSFLGGGKEYQAWKGMIDDANKSASYVPFANKSANGTDTIPITSEYSYAGLMTNGENGSIDEVGIFMGLYNKAMEEGREPIEAKAFLDGLQQELSTRYSEIEDVRVEETAKLLPIGSSVASQMMKLSSSYLDIPRHIAHILGDKSTEDPNSWWYATSRQSELIEKTISDELGGVAGKTYLNFMNSASNMLRALTVPQGASGSKIVQSIMSLGSFFLQVDQESTARHLQDGMGYTEASTAGALDGVFEVFEELLPFETMLGTEGVNLGLSLLLNAATEMGQEFTGATLFKRLRGILDGTDEEKQRSNQILNDGYYINSDGEKVPLSQDNETAIKEARGIAAKEFWQEAEENGFGGAFGGGFSGFYGTVANAIGTNRYDQKTGERILESGVEETDDTKTRMGKEGTNTFKLLEIGEGFQNGTQTKQIADSIRAGIRAGKGVSKSDIGKLARSIVGESSERVSDVTNIILGDVFKEELQESGVKNPEKISNALVKMIAQGDYSRDTLTQVFGNNAAMKVLREYRMGKFQEQVKSINEQTKIEQAASKSVMEMLPQANDANVTADAVKKIVSGAVTASKDDIKNAEGQRTGNATETVSEGKIADIAGIALKSVDVEVEGDDGKPKTEQQTRWQITMSDGRVVDIADVKATNQDVAETLAFLQNDSGKVIGQNLADAVMKIATTKKAGKAGGDMATTLSGAVRIMWAAATEQATPKISGMSEEDAAAITEAVKADLEESEKKRLSGFTVLAPGKGVTTLNGVAYGSNAFDEMLNKVVRDNNLGKSIKTEAKVIGAIAKSVGAQVELYYDANDTKNQGMFTAGGGIRINMAGTTNTEGAHRSALATFAHEVTHNIEANSPDAYRALRSFVFTSLGGKLNIQNELSRIQAAYAHYGEHLDIAGAVSELVAKACETVLTDESVIRQLQEQDADLAGTVGDAVTELVGRVQSIKGDALTSASMYARAMGDVSRGLSQAWMGAYKEAAGAKGTTTAAGKAQASRTEITNQDYENAVKSGNVLAVQDMLYQKAEANGATGYAAVHKKGARSTEIAEAIKRKDPEAIATAAKEMSTRVPNNAVLIPIPPHTGTVTEDTDTYLLAKAISEITGSPVINALGSNEHISRKEAKKTGNRNVTADAMGFRQIAEIPEGMTPVFIDNMVGGGSTAIAARNAVGRGFTLAYAQSTRSKTMGVKSLSAETDNNENLIPYNERMDMTSKSWKRSISDEAYMDAVQAGDMNEAQRIVDETAKANGFTETVYHGTPTGGFTVFKDWSYFTKNRDYAARYQHASASSVRGSYDTTNPMIYELYMNPGKVFDTRKPAHAKIYNQMRMEYGLDELGNTSSGLPDWTAGRDIAEFIEEKGLDFDTFLLDEGADGGYGEEVVSRGISYVTRSNRVKSAEAVTRDNNDEIIPPSERFKVKEPDIRFSMQEPVEINKDGLIAVHNLTRQNLYDTLQEGGFTAPSIAVIWASMGHTKYGEISVVFKPQSIDPRKSVKNKVYGTDAWTPTRGNAQIETKLNYEVIQNVRDQIEQLLSGEDVNEFKNDALNWINHWLYEDQTTDTMDEIIRKAYNNDGMMIAYEKANGREIEKKTTFEKNHPELRGDSIKLYNGFLNHLDELGMLQEFLYDMVEETGFTILEKYTDIFGESSEEARKYVDAYKKDPDSRLNRNLIYNKLKQARWFQEDGREIKTYNKYSPQETAESIRDNLNKTDFDNWIRGMMEGALGKKGVYNGKDLFTSSGNRKSFEATHDEPTAENIVRAMYRNHSAKGGEAGGATGLMAKASKEYRNLKEVRADASRLQTMDEEEYRNLVRALDQKLDDFAKRISENYSELDYYSIKQELIDAGEVYAKQGTAESIRRYLAKQGIKLDADQIIEAKAIMDEAQNMPTGYFEAKPETVVGFDEIDKVIMPADSKLERMLADRNIPYVVTDGTEEDRLEKLNERQEAKFSIQDEMDYDVQSWMETVPEWSLQTEAEKTLIQDYKSLRMKMRLDQERESQTLADIRKLEELLAGPAEGSVTRPETMENALEAAGVQIKPADPTKILSNPTLIKNGKIIGFIFGDDRVRVSNKADPAIFEEMGFAVDRKTKMATYVNPEGNQMGNTATKKKLEALKVKLQNIRNSLEKTRVKLAEITSGEGFGGMMYRQQQVLNDLLYNKTQGEVQDSVERMQARADAVAKTIEENQKIIEEMEKGGIVEKLKKILGTTTAEQAVSELKKLTNSTWTKNEITPLFNEIVLKMTQGQDYQQDIENLAGILVNSSKDNAALDEDLSALRGMTLIISEGQLKELKGQGSSLKEIRQRLAGTGITVKTGEYSSLTDNLDDTIAEYGPALFQDLGDEKDALENFVTRVEQRRNDAIISNQYAERLANTMAQIAAKAAGVAQGIYMPSDRTAQKQVLAMMEYVKGLAAQTQQAQKTLQGIADDMAAIQKEGRQASGMAGALARDVNVALDYYSRINQVAQQSARNQRQQAIIEQLKSKQAEKILKNNEEWRKLIERDAQARKQTEENAKTRGKINTVVKRMYNLLKNPKGTTNIPESMQGIARTVLESIVGNDLGGLKLTRVPAKDLAEISRVLRAWTERDGAPTMPTAGETSDDASLEIIEQDVQKIRDGISQYNADIRGANKVETLQQRGEILKGIQEALSEIYTRIRTENEVFVRGRQVQVANAAHDVIEDTEGKNYREWSGFFGRKLAALHKMIVSGNMTPEYFFRTLSNNGLTALWDNYHDAENRNGLELAKSKARMEEIADRYGYSNWDMKTRQTVKLASGDVQMTLGQIMSLWATWNREQQLGPEMSRHLTSGGFYTEEQDLRDGLLGRTEVQKKAHRVTEEDMANVERMLTQEQKNFVNAVVRYMSQDMSELGNEASMAAYGIKMYKENYYFPMQMWDGIKSRKSNDAAQGASIDRAFHPSFSKSRAHGANNALVIGDFMQVATDHIAGMINYATMGLANESLQKVLNYTLTEGENAEEATKRNVRARLEEAYGLEAMQYLLELQKQLNGGAVRIEKTIYDKLISTFRKNAVAGSLSVALQQPMSYVRAAMLINPKYLAAALSPTNWKGSYKEMMQYSGVAVIKDMGRFDMNAGQSAREYLTPDGKESTGRKAWNKFQEGVTILPELMDRMTWTRMWSAVKAEQKAQHPEMSATSEEFLQMCGERFNDVMRRTQVYDSVLVKSANMRNQNPVMKSITSFMAEPTLTLNVLADAVRAAKTGETGGKGLLIKAGATFMLSAVLQAAIKGLMGSGRNPDDKKTWEENFLYRFFSSFISEADPLQLIPGFSDLITILKDGKLEDDAMSTIGKITTAFTKTRDVIGGQNSKGWYRDIEDSAGQLVQLFSNVPLKNLMRDGRAMYNWVTQPYADRETSGNVIANQTADLIANADNFIGVINNWLGDAGYKTDNAAYKKRVYEAMKNGDDAAAQNYIDYLINGKGVKSEESIMKGTNSVTSYTLEDYQAGNITRTRADELLKIANPKMKDQDRAKKLDEIDYESKTGKEVESYSLYTPLFDAMDQGNAGAIDEQKKHLTEVGVKENTITSNMKSHIKSRYESGEITRAQAEEQYKKYAPTMKQQDIIKALDEVDYEKETGEDVDSYSLYTRIYNAIDSSDAATVKSQKSYLKTVGIEEKDVNSQIASYISSQYKEGKIKKTDAESKLKSYAGKSDDDVWWILDRIDYTKQTGKEVDSSAKYYRLYDAMDANKAADIQTAVKNITGHGTYESNVKTAINGHYKQLYLNGSESQKVAIQDAMQKAYEALGYKKKSANTTINNWKKGK